jgi:hypothetical protein
MGTRRTPGLFKRGRVWHTGKLFRGTRIRESTATGRLDEAWPASAVRHMFVLQRHRDESGGPQILGDGVIAVDCARQRLDLSQQLRLDVDDDPPRVRRAGRHVESDCSCSPPRRRSLPALPGAAGVAAAARTARCRGSLRSRGCV